MISHNLNMNYQITTKVKTGGERFIGTNRSLLDYWQWAHSDIASNSERGKLAEFIVSCAVNAPSPYRIEWDAVDVVSEDGIRIEVKSSAYLQSWKCNKLSKIQFDIAPKKSWDSKNNRYYETMGRNSDVYVFCLFACQNPSVANPLDLDQWEFFVLSTKVLNDSIPMQKTISMRSLLKLGAVKTNFHGLSSIIHKAISRKVEYSHFICNL